MRYLLLSLILTNVFTGTFAQQNRTKQQKLDSLKQKLAADSAHIYRPRLAKPYLRVENRYSFISRRPVNLIGFMAGATFIERHILCGGYYVLNRFEKKSIELEDENNMITREYLSFNYFVFSYQYVLLNRRFVQIHTPVEIGYGPYSTRTTDRFNAFVGKSTGNIVPLSAGVQFILKPIRWVGISTVGGYRHAFQKKDVHLNFTGFYYSFGLWVDARYILRATRYYFRKQSYRHEADKIMASAG